MVNIDQTARTASSVIGIAGMGIGLGLLAHTAKNISRATDDLYRNDYYERRSNSRRPYQQRQQKNTTKNRSKSTMYNNYWSPKY